MSGISTLEYDFTMRRLIQIVFAAWFAFSMGLAQAFAFSGDSTGGTYTPVSSSAPDTSGYTKDSAKSDALTDYMKTHRLPLVGAQVLTDPASGQHVVVLYGFAATDFGKADATSKASTFLHDPAAVIENRVKVDPEIASLPKTSHHHQSADEDSSGYAADPGASNAANADQGDGDADAMPGAQSYLDQQDQQSQIQQYKNQGNPFATGPGMSGGMGSASMGLGSMGGLVALLGLLSAANGGSSFSYGSSSPLGSFGRPSPYGGSPYGPQYGAPYGSPYGGGGYPPSAYPSSPYGGGNSGGYPPPGYSPYP
jgi:hypothetical protein